MLNTENQRLYCFPVNGRWNYYVLNDTGTYLLTEHGWKEASVRQKQVFRDNQNKDDFQEHNLEYLVSIGHLPDFMISEDQN
jgi:hypothetical protein